MFLYEGVKDLRNELPRNLKSGQALHRQAGGAHTPNGFLVLLMPLVSQIVPGPIAEHDLGHGSLGAV